jgi:phosphinothricin acetyltransferase
MLFRASIDSDLPAILAIYRHYVLHTTSTFETEVPSLDEMSRRRAEILAIGLPFLVAEADGEVAGYAYATRYRPRGAYRYTLEDSIYLHPAHTGKGAGSGLLASVIEACEAWGARQLIAVIGGSDNAASIGLHTKFGFRHAGLLRSAGYKFDRWADSVLMQRSLGPGDITPPDK